MKKKKTEKVGIISGMEILKNTRPMQDIPFRTGVYSDKRKKREKVNKNKLEKWLQILSYVFCASATSENQVELLKNKLHSRTQRIFVRITYEN